MEKDLLSCRIMILDPSFTVSGKPNSINGQFELTQRSGFVRLSRAQYETIKKRIDEKGFSYYLLTFVGNAQMNHKFRMSIPPYPEFHLLEQDFDDRIHFNMSRGMIITKIFLEDLPPNVDLEPDVLY